MDCPNTTQLVTVWDIKGVPSQNFQDNKQARLKKLAHITIFNSFTVIIQAL